MIFLSLLICALLGFLAFSYLTSDYFSVENKYDDIIKAAAKRHCVDSNLLKAVVWKESNFDATVRGAKGEIGLMQVIRKAAAQDWAEFNNVPVPCEGIMFNPRLNIEIGAWYLSKSMRKWNDFRCREELALSEYNAGGKRASKWKPDDRDGDVISRITIRSTRNYVESIMNKYFEYNDRKIHR